MTESKSGALSGLKVLDLGRMVAGPYCSMLLAAMGAEVIKIEAPGSGDMARVNLPMQNGVSTYFVAYNCNKDDLTLDLKSAEGKEILRKLIMQADVLVENFRPGVMKRLGFDYDAVHQMNPRLVYASISGYGQEGELATRAAFDPVAQAMAGMVSITGTDAAHSVRCGASVADILAGQNAAVAVLGALMYREKSGCGQHIDISLVDSCISAMASVNQIYLSTGKIPAPLGNGFEASANYDYNQRLHFGGSLTYQDIKDREAMWNTMPDALSCGFGRSEYSTVYRYLESLEDRGFSNHFLVTAQEERDIDRLENYGAVKVFRTTQ